MNDKDNYVIEALGRVNRFAKAHLAAFPAGSQALADFARAGAISAELVPTDSKPGIPASPATAARNHLFDEVWEDLLGIADTARTIARNEPGFAADFRLGDDTHREIISTATAFLAKLQDPATVAKFITYSMPRDFVSDLQIDLAAIDDKKSEQIDDRIEDISDNAHNRALIKEARELIKNLSTSVKNRFRRDSAILAEWATASRIHRSGGSSGSSDAPVVTPPPTP
jgi:hypothetical protein